MGVTSWRGVLHNMYILLSNVVMWFIWVEFCVEYVIVEIGYVTGLGNNVQIEFEIICNKDT